MLFLFYDKKKIIIKFTKIDSGVYYFHESQCAFIFHQNKSDNRRFEARLGLFLQKLIHLIITILSFRRTLRKNWRRCIAVRSTYIASVEKISSLISLFHIHASCIHAFLDGFSADAHVHYQFFHSFLLSKVCLPCTI